MPPGHQLRLCPPGPRGGPAPHLPGGRVPAGLFSMRGPDGTIQPRETLPVSGTHRMLRLVQDEGLDVTHGIETLKREYKTAARLSCSQDG